MDNVFVETHTIKESYSRLHKEFQTDPDQLLILKEANDCLTSMKCRDQYTRFGNTIKVDLDTAEVELDWKMAFSVCFYMLFAFIHSAASKVEQKPGLRFSMGIGIMFCANEIQIL